LTDFFTQLHWLRVNIPASAFQNEYNDGWAEGSGESVVSYMGPAPPSETGLHRYIFLVFKQSGPVQVDQSAAKLIQRNNFDWHAWVKQQHVQFELLEGNYFNAQHH